MDLARPLVEVLLAAWPLPRTWLVVDDVEQWLNRLPKPMAPLIVAIARRLEAGEPLPMRADIEQVVREELQAAGLAVDPAPIVTIVELILQVQAGQPLPARAELEQVVREKLAATGADAEFDPTIIVLIVELILKLIEWRRNRK